MSEILCQSTLRVDPRFPSRRQCSDVAVAILCPFYLASGPFKLAAHDKLATLFFPRQLEAQ
jgi:hypothetical protein